MTATVTAAHLDIAPPAGHQPLTVLCGQCGYAISGPSPRTPAVLLNVCSQCGLDEAEGVADA